MAQISVPTVASARLPAILWSDQLVDRLVGGVNQPLLKNMRKSNLEIISPIFRVKIQKIFELPPPSYDEILVVSKWDP